MNDRAPNSPEREDRSGLQRRKNWPSTQRIGKDIRTSSYFFTRRVADVVPEACFSAMNRDRYNVLAAIWTAA